MTRISIRGSFFSKNITPWILITLALLFGYQLVTLLFSKAYQQAPLSHDPRALIVTLMVIAVLGLIHQIAIAPSMDQVFDCGDHLLIQNAGQKLILPFKAIKTIRFINYLAIDVIYLTTHQPTAFGSELKFIPKISFSPLGSGKYRDVKQVIARIKAQD